MYFGMRLKNKLINKAIKSFLQRGGAYATYKKTDPLNPYDHYTKIYYVIHPNSRYPTSQMVST